MTEDLLDRAIQNPHTPEHRDLFRNLWLPQALGKQYTSAYNDLADEYLISMHPGIYNHGPNYNQLVESMARLELLMDNDEPNLFSNLLDVNQEHEDFINFNLETTVDNPDYAYRICTEHQVDLQIPHYEACVKHPKFKTWAEKQVDSQTGEQAVQALDIADSYKEVLLTVDVLRSIPEFRQCLIAFENFQREYDMPQA